MANLGQNQPVFQRPPVTRYEPIIRHEPIAREPGFDMDEKKGVYTTDDPATLLREITKRKKPRV